MGVVDWAEAEWLPFGMALYGVEHFLGYMSASPGVEFGREREFVWYGSHEQLREYFWRSLVEGLPALREEESWKAVCLSREIGILLWHGVAWDEGRIDRVINAVDDPDEFAFLEAFLLDSKQTLDKSKL
jgi:hypothetical protein